MSYLFPVLAVLAALGVGAILIYIAGANPLVAYRSLFVGAFGSQYGITETLKKATPLLLLSLGLVVAFKCSVWNMGGTGQMILGGLAATWVGLTFAGFPAILLISLVIAGGFLAGALWGAIPGLFKARLGVHEVISTILMNLIAIQLVAALIEGPMLSPVAMDAMTSLLPSSAWLPVIPGTRLHTGFLIALLCVPLVYLLLWRTKFGYQLRAVGKNPNAARFGGISVPKTIVTAMIISGGLAGVAGIIQILGIFHLAFPGFDQYYAWTAIVLAQLGRLHPAGVLLASILFGALLTGGETMHRTTGVPVYLIFAIQGLILLFVLASEYLIQRKG